MFKDKYRPQDPDGKIENSGKCIFEIRIPNFCYIQVIVFDLRLRSLAIYQSQRLGLSKYASMKKREEYKRQLGKVKNYILNVTENRDSDFKNAFPEIFNFTVEILIDL